MPMMEQGIYTDTGDKPSEFESCYYLNFQITSALYSLACIDNYKSARLDIFESESQYLHYYTDHLLYSIGQISSRFAESKNDQQNERVKLNRSNFQFSSKDYPILSNKKYRNTIEHIDEYNQYVIERFHGVGGFNFIDVSVDPQMMYHVLQNKQSHIYTLDLIDRKIYIQRKEKELILNVDELKTELTRLRNSVNSFYNAIKNSPFEGGYCNAD